MTQQNRWSMHRGAKLVLLGGAVAVALTAACDRIRSAKQTAKPASEFLTSVRGMTPLAVRRALLKELRTVTLKNCTLARYGGANDGGYLMCRNLAGGGEVAYSYGIDLEDNWGCQVSREFGVRVHQYDCFTEHRPVCEGGAFVFHDECVGPAAETVEGRAFDTIASQIARNGDSGKRLLFKMDIEGAEWDSLLATPDHVLDAIIQMPMELHGINDPKILAVVRWLKQRFHLVSLHFNNAVCTQDPLLPSRAFQVLWVNKRVGVLDPEGPSPAPLSPLLAPDFPALPDCQLDTSRTDH